MAVRTKEQLKGYFLPNAKPGAGEFGDLVDSMRNKGERIPAIDVEGFEAISTGIAGEAKPDTVPVGIFGIYAVSEPGVYVNFLDGDGNPIGVTQDDLDAGVVQLWGEDGVWKKVVSGISGRIESWQAKAYPSGKNVLHDGLLWLSVDDATSADVPGLSPDVWEKALRETEIVDDATSTDVDKALSANQGRVLAGEIDGVKADYLPKSGVVDDLETYDPGRALSVRQGAILKGMFEGMGSTGIAGEAKVDTVPIATGFVIYAVNVAGVFVNFLDGDGVPVEVLQDDLDAGAVQLWGQDNVWKKHLIPIEFKNPTFSDNLEVANVVRSVAPSGSVVLSNVLDKLSGNVVTFKEVVNYCDGTIMDDSKVDEELYIKVDGKYFLKSFDEKKSRTLSLNSVDELRNLSIQDVILIRLGYYRKVETKGYYSDGDGGGIDYVVKNGSPEDDGYLVIRTTNDSGIYFVPNIKDMTHPRLAGCKGDGTFDDGPRLNLFFEKNLELGRSVLINWVGSWYVKDTVNLVGDGRVFISGAIFYTGTTSLEYLLIINTVGGHHKRAISVRGSASSSVNMTNYTHRRCVNLVGLGRCRTAKFDGFNVHGARRWGVRILSGGTTVSNTISGSLGIVDAVNCGSVGTELGKAIWDYYFDCVSTSRHGSQNSVNQTQRFYVDGDIHEHLAVGDILTVNNEPVEIQSLNHEEGYISVFPWLSQVEWTGGQVNCRHGGALRVHSSDSASLQVENINALRCGVALHMQGLYGLVLRGMVAQVAGVSILQKGLCYGFNVLNFHSETAPGVGIDFLKTDSYETRTTISGLSVLRWGDWKRLIAKNNLGRIENMQAGSLHGVTVTDGYNGVFTAINNIPRLTNAKKDNFYAASGNISFNLIYNEDADRLFNMRAAKLFWIGSRTGSTNYTLNVGITASQQSEFTIMGQPSWSLPAQRYDVVVEFYIKGKDWRVVWYTIPPVIQNELGTVVKIGESGVVRLIETEGIIKSKSATLTTSTDMQIFANSETEIGNVTLTDASPGDVVNVSQSAVPGLSIKGVVSAANTITLSGVNATFSDIILYSGAIFKVVILK